MGKVEEHDIVAALKRLASELGKTPTLRDFLSTKFTSRRQIDKYGYNKLVEQAGLEVNYDPFKHHTLQARAPKILLYDIETSALVTHAWGLFDQNIGLNQIVQDWFVMSWSAKWLDSDEVFYEDVRKTVKKSDPDKKILQGIHKLLSEADVVVSYNGDSFDAKKLNARFIKFGMPPVSPYKSIDCLKIARRYFKFTSNKLEYVAKYLGCVLQKSKHKKYLGHELWKECMGGNLEAFDEMKEYNVLDTKVLEEVYRKLIPFDNSISFSAFHQVSTCTCGSTNFVKDGYKYTAKGAFQRYTCKKCGKVVTDKTNLIHKDIRKELLA